MTGKIYSIFKRLYINLRSYGLVTTCKTIGLLLSKMMYVNRQNYDFVLLPPTSSSKTKVPTGAFAQNWYIPDFDIGSGGHSTIFRIASFLYKMGHQIRIVIIPPTKFSDPTRAAKLVRDRFTSEFEGDFYFLGDGVPDADAHIATSWETAYYVNSASGSGDRFYFVQDFEPMFFPMGAEYVFAENTYRFDLKCIAASPWLSQMLHQRYGAKAGHFLLAYDSQQYFPENIARNKKTVAFYARHLTARRGFDLGVLALQLVYQADPDVEFVFYGANAYPDVPMPCSKSEILSHSELRSLYSSATVGLVISLTNYSLIPNEMMACGLPVVDIDTECMRGLYEHNLEIMLSLPNPESIAENILSLLKNPVKCKDISLQALNKVREITWDRSAIQIDKLMHEL